MALSFLIAFPLGYSSSSSSAIASSCKCCLRSGGAIEIMSLSFSSDGYLVQRIGQCCDSGIVFRGKFRFNVSLLFMK